MQFRKADPQDLPQLTEMYARIYKDMQSKGIYLWNEQYPAGALPGDISAGRLWLLCGSGTVAAAFALDTDEPCGDIQWQEPSAKAAILMRLGVDPACSGKGLGRSCIEFALEKARSCGFEFLRLIVADCNVPAGRFYDKCGFTRVPGVHLEQFGGEVLTGYGCEFRL